MCGIAGWIGRDAGASVLSEMSGCLTHRGPDGEGSQIIDLGHGHTAGLGHRRLAIIDRASGGQPMSTQDGRLTITYNGELYNYLELRSELQAMGVGFATRSDTEVILESWRRWGEAAVKKFHGMYAFALHDATDNSVHLVRDPFGEKPLYVYVAGGEADTAIVFASEIPALLRHPDVPAAIDHSSVYDFLVWRYVPGPYTMYQGVRKVRPGTIISWKSGSISEHSYFIPPEARRPETRPALPDDPIGSLRKILENAVAIRLRSDVPVGMFLSSGLDSASILAFATDAVGPGFPCYSIGFSDGAESELADAEAVAAEFGADFVPVMVSPEDVPAQLAAMTKTRAGPVSEPADIAVQAMAVQASQDVRVVLTGEGADELFAGYPKHIVESHLPSIGMLHRFGGPALTAAGRCRLGNPRLELLARALGLADPRDRLVHWFGGITGETRNRVWIGDEAEREPDRMPFSPYGGQSGLRRALHFDQTSWLPDNVLERTDIATMSASVEARAPFLDVRLADLAVALPDVLRLRGRKTKVLLRAAMESRLPAAVMKRKKKGFPIPVAAWFRGSLRDVLEDTVGAPDSRVGAYVDRDWIRNLITDHHKGRASHHKALWMLLSLETFLRSA